MEIPIESQAYFTIRVFVDWTAVADVSRPSTAYIDIEWAPDVVDKILPVYEKLTFS